MNNSFRSKLIMTLGLSCLFSTQVMAQAKTCDLVIKSVAQSDEGKLSFDLYSSMAGLAPYKVSLSQLGKTVSTWSQVAHTSNQPLSVSGVTVSGVTTVKIESIGVLGCVAEKEISIAPVIQAPNSACDLVIKGFTQVSDSVLLDIYSSKANINPYNVQIVQGNKTLGSWVNVAHTKDAFLKLEGIKGSGDVSVTVTSSKVAACTAQTVMTLKSASVSDNKSCKEGPSIQKISNISSTGATVLFHGVDVLGIDYVIDNSAGVAVASGAFNPQNNSPLIPYSSLAAGNYKLTFKGNTCVGSSSKEFTISGSANPSSGNPTSGVAACKEGPVLGSISNISSTGLSAQFHGVDVFAMDYTIESVSGDILRTGSIVPKNNTPAISYSALAAGKYVLNFQATSCLGSSRKEFTVTGSAGGSTPNPGGPVAALPVACKAGPDIRTISNVSSSSLTALFHGEEVYGMDYKILNSNGSTVASGAVTLQNNTPNISFPSLSAGDYTLVFSGSTCVGESSKSFQIAGVTTPPASAGGTSGASNGGSSNACKAGPQITGISDISKVGLTFQFHGEGIAGIDYSILDASGSSKASGAIAPQSSSLGISYSTLPAGNYTLKIAGNKCTGESSQAFSIVEINVGNGNSTGNPSSGDNLAACSAGPTIGEISGVTATSLLAKFDGDGIASINYTIVNSSGSNVGSGQILPKSSTVTASYPAISDGNYTLVFKAGNCSGGSVKAFNYNSKLDLLQGDVGVVLGSNSNRQIFMNLTGYGFSPDDPTGINVDWRTRIEKFNSLTHNGVKFKGIDGIEVTMKWADYETKDGVFRDDGILKAVQYCKKNGLKLAFIVWPYRDDGDGFLPESDKVTGQNGTVYKHEGHYHLPAYYSQIGRTKLKRMAEKLASTLAPYSDMVEYVTMVYGTALEHTNPLIAVHSPSYYVAEITGYEQANRDAFKKFSASFGLGELDAPVPRTENLPWPVVDMVNADVRGKLWYKFISNGLKETLNNFNDGVKSGSGNRIKTAGHFADAAGTQSAWYYTYDIKDIYGSADIIYSSDGTNPYDLMNKMMATDVMKGTFPDKKVAIEFDPEDVGFGGKDYGMPINPQSLIDFGSSFFRRGGNYLHFAMAFSTGENGSNDEVSSLAGALYELRTKYIQNEPIALPSETKTVPLVKLQGDQFRDPWYNGGGSRDKQVKIIQDSSNFWNFR